MILQHDIAHSPNAVRLFGTRQFGIQRKLTGAWPGPCKYLVHSKCAACALVSAQAAHLPKRKPEQNKAKSQTNPVKKQGQAYPAPAEIDKRNNFFGQVDRSRLAPVITKKGELVSILLIMK